MSKKRTNNSKSANKQQKTNEKEYKGFPFSKDEIEEMEAEAKQEYDENVKPELEAENKEAEHKFNKIIDTQQDFLSLFNDERYKFNIIFEENLIPIELKKVSAGDDLSFMDIQYDPYMNLSEEEKGLIDRYSKAQKENSRVSPKDEIAIAHLKDKVDKKADAETIKESQRVSAEVLARYVIKPEVPGNLRARRKFWMDAPTNFMVGLAGIVLDKLGLNKEATVELFQDD